MWGVEKLVREKEGKRKERKKGRKRKEGKKEGKMLQNFFM